MATTEPLAMRKYMTAEIQTQAVAARGVPDIGSNARGSDIGTHVAQQTVTAVPALRHQCIAQESPKHHGVVKIRKQVHSSGKEETSEMHVFPYSATGPAYIHGVGK